MKRKPLKIKPIITDPEISEFHVTKRDVHITFSNGISVHLCCNANGPTGDYLHLSMERAKEMQVLSRASNYMNIGYTPTIKK